MEKVSNMYQLDLIAQFGTVRFCGGICVFQFVRDRAFCFVDAGSCRVHGETLAKR